MTLHAPPDPVGPRPPSPRRPASVLVVAVASIVLGAALGVGVLVGTVPGARTVLAPLAAPALDLHVHDWGGAILPGAVCRSPIDIALRDGQALAVPSSFGGPEPNYPQDVTADLTRVVYGDLDGDGHDEAALPVTCANHDSTLAGLNVSTTLLFDGASGSPVLVGTVESAQPRLGEIPNDVDVERLEPGRVTGTEHAYGPLDANCCPSGTADTVWPFVDGALGTPRSTVVVPAAGTPAPAADPGMPAGGSSGDTSGGIAVEPIALDAVRRTPGIDQSNVERVGCAEPTVRADDVVLGCTIYTSGSFQPGVVAVHVVSVATADVETYVMVKDSGCPGIPAWAAKINGDRSDHPCGG